MDDVEIQETLDEQIASSLEAAQNAPVKEKLRHLKKVSYFNELWKFMATRIVDGGTSP